MLSNAVMILVSIGQSSLSAWPENVEPKDSVEISGMSFPHDAVNQVDIPAACSG